MAVYRRQSKKGYTSEARIRVQEVSYSKGGFATKAEARRAEAELLKAASLGELTSDKMTVKALVERYLAFQRGPGATLRASSLKRAEAAWRALEPFWGPLGVQAVNGGNLTKYQTHRLSEGMAPATINQELRTLRAVLTWGAERGLASPVIWPRGFELREPEPVNKVLLPGQDGLLDKIPLEWLRDLARLLLQTGLRPGEALTLTWGDIDLKAGTLTVRTSKTHKARIVPLTDSARALLNKRFHLNRNGDLVFTTSSGGAISTAYAGRTWGRLSQGLGILGEGGQVPTLHSLRHTVATRLQRAGYSDSEIAALLGHSATAAITRRYLHSSVDRLRALTGALEIAQGQ